MSFLTDKSSYTLSFIKHSDHLEVHITAEKDSYEIAIRYWTEIAEELKQAGLAKAMVIENIAEESDLSDIFRLASELADKGLWGLKVAVVDKHPGHKELNDFGVMVATNRGLKGRSFSDADKARQWLLDDSA